MLATKRTERVSGRMTFLISSTNTIKFISAIGVPLGTKCRIEFLVLFNHPIILIEIHEINEMGITTEICPVEENV
jgi:hypothetical protein